MSSPKMMRRLIVLEPEPQRLVHRIADPIFARRQNFVVQLRQFASDIRGRARSADGSSAFSASAYSVTDPLFDFVVEIREVVRVITPSAINCSFHLFSGSHFCTSFRFFRAAIKFLIVRAGVTGEAFHHHPEKNRAFSGAHVSECFRGLLIHFCQRWSRRVPANHSAETHRARGD